METLKDALRVGKPDIFDSDQGTQFTAYLKKTRYRSAWMVKDGMQTIFLQKRFWRCLKYKEVYPKEYESYSVLSLMEEEVLRQAPHID